MTNSNQPKRLIEVTLPLAEISVQSAREKSIRHGHISTLHIWWARRPLAAMRAAIFASLIPDPGFEMVERARLYSQIDDSSGKIP
jgi:putative DNA methylase